MVLRYLLQPECVVVSRSGPESHLSSSTMLEGDLRSSRYVLGVATKESRQHVLFAGVILISVYYSSIGNTKWSPLRFIFELCVFTLVCEENPQLHEVFAFDNS